MINVSLDDSRLDCFRSLKGRNALDNDSIVIESERAIDKFILVHKKAEVLLATPQWLETSSLALNSFTNILCLPKKEMEQLIGYKYHQGVIAMAKLPTSSSIDKLTGNCLILNSVSSPENVGALIRSAAGLGIENVIFDHDTCHPFIRRCIRVSMGNIFFMKWHHTYNLSGAIKKLQDQSYDVVGGANETDSIFLTLHTWAHKSAIVIGSEGHGIAKDIRGACDKLLKIPMKQEVAHLNAAGAGAILMYDCFRSQLA